MSTENNGQQEFRDHADGLHAYFFSANLLILTLSYFESSPYPDTIHSHHAWEYYSSNYRIKCRRYDIKKASAYARNFTVYRVDVSREIVF